MPGAKGNKTGASRADGDNTRRGARRRTLLNLGIPFVPVDDFVNQAENAVAMGYRVLEDVVTEIKKGFDQAVEYNKKQIDASAAGDPAPPIPWQQVVDRVERMNDITLGVMERGNRIFLDSVAAGMNATNKLARTLANTRADADEQLPKLAGPVFDDLLSVKFRRGQVDAVAEWKIDHRGLTRLRVLARVSPLQQLGEGVSLRLPAPTITFEPAAAPDQEKTSVLKLRFKKIPDTQMAGRYQGLVTATNFDLLIARLQIEIEANGSAKQTRKVRAGGSSKR